MNNTKKILRSLIGLSLLVNATSCDINNDRINSNYFEYQTPIKTVWGEQKACDMNGDGYITRDELNIIKNFYRGKINEN